MLSNFDSPSVSANVNVFTHVSIYNNSNITTEFIVCCMVYMVKKLFLIFCQNNFKDSWLIYKISL